MSDKKSVIVAAICACGDHCAFAGMKPGFTAIRSKDTGDLWLMEKYEDGTHNILVVNPSGIKKIQEALN